MTHTFADNLVSDLHKDARGSRPGPNFMDAWAFESDDGKQAIWDSLIDEMVQSELETEQAEASALADFKSQIRSVMDVCSCSWDEAVRHLQFASGEQDTEHFLWSQGLSYSKMVEIQNLMSN